MRKFLTDPYHGVFEQEEGVARGFTRLVGPGRGRFGEVDVLTRRVMFAVAVVVVGGRAQASDAAGEEPPPTPRETYESIVVGRRVPETAFESDRSVSVVGERDIEDASPRTVPEALYESVGVFVQQTNHGGGSPIVRGLIGPQVLLMVDGVRLNNSVYRTGPVQYLNLLEPTLIGRVEVLRGPGSVLYGSDAMGGVILVMPIEPREPRPDGGMAGGGALTTRFASADLGRTVHGHADFATRAARGLGGISFKWLSDLRGGSGVGAQRFSGYDQWSSFAGLEFRVTEGALKGSSVSAKYLYSYIQDAGRTDQLAKAGSLIVYDNEDHLAWLRIKVPVASIRTEFTATGSFQGFFERSDQWQMAGDLETRLGVTRDELTARTLGMDVMGTTSLLGRRLKFQYGGMWYRDWVEANRARKVGEAAWSPTAEGPYPDASTYNNDGVFLHAAGEPVRTESGHTLRLEAGYRLHGMSGHAPASGGLAEVEFSHLGHVFQAGVQYAYLERVTVAATFSQGFRAPNLQEAIHLGDAGKSFHVPNPDLGPERCDTVEVLSRLRLSWLDVSVAGYVSFLRDLIKREGTLWNGLGQVAGKQVERNANGSGGLLWGIESGVSAVVGLGLSARAHVTYTWGEEHVPGKADVPLTRIPPLFGWAGVRWDIPAGEGPRAFVESFVRWAAKQDRLSPEDLKDPRIPEGGTPGWWTLNLRASARFSDRYRTGLAIENLFNRKYRYHGSGLWAPGLNVVATLDMDI